MVHKSSDEPDMQEEENNKKGTGRFSYQGKKQKTDPWKNLDFQKQESPDAFGSPRTSGTKVFNGNVPTAHSDFDFESVWSVRKNVPLPSTRKQPSTQANTQSTNSHYSRHGGGFLGNQQSKAASKTDLQDKNNNASTWNAKRSGYSYAGQGSVKRQANASDDDDDEFDFTESKSKHSKSGSLQQQNQSQQSLVSGRGSLASAVNPLRKGSARTQRAQKMHTAYLRSAGLGDYEASGSFPRNHEDEDQ